jgi:DNA-binding IclR family transcriptional regulator
VAVLTAISADPRRGVTLSEIVRRTGFPKATCHAVLASLVEARWLLRHPVGPTYQLGPALIALGDAAGRGFPALPFAEDELRGLCVELHVEGLVTARVSGEIAILAKAGTPAPLSVSVSVGQRLPFAPPLASAFVAWEDAGALDELLGGLTPARRQRYLETLAAVRRRGFAVALESRAREHLGRALASSAVHGRATTDEVNALLDQLDREDYQLLDLRRGDTYEVNHLSAPVFDANGAVSLVVTLVGLPPGLRGREIEQLGQRLRSAADRATVGAHGRVPAGRAPSGSMAAR